MKKNGFNQVYYLDNESAYEGNAKRVMLVWNENQIFSAEQYRKANYPNESTNIVVCQDPNIQKEQLGDKAIIYDFS